MACLGIAYTSKLGKQHVGNHGYIARLIGPIDMSIIPLSFHLHGHDLDKIVDFSAQKTHLNSPEASVMHMLCLTATSRRKLEVQCVTHQDMLCTAIVTASTGIFCE